MAALDQMDYLMHQPDTAGSTQGSSFHGLPQHQGYPYFCNQQQHHGPGLPPPHFAPGFHPMAHQLPHLSQLSHTGHPSSDAGPQNRAFHSSPVGGSHGQEHQHQQHQHQQQQQQQQQTHPGPQTQPQSQPPSSQPQTQSQSQPQQQLPPIQPPTLPYPQPYAPSHSHSQSHSHLSHHSSHYDPVHAANAAWLQNQNNQQDRWLTRNRLLAQHTFFVNQFDTQTAQFPQSRPPATDSHFGGSGSGSGVVQPLSNPNQQFSPYYGPYTPLGYSAFHRPATYQRSSVSLPAPPQLSNDQPNRQDHADENHQPSQHSQALDSHPTPVAMSSDPGAPPPDRRGFTLPALNPNSNSNSNQPSSSSQSNTQAASSSREPSPPNVTTSADAPAAAAPAAATPNVQLPLPSEYPNVDYNNRGNGYRITTPNAAPSRGQSVIPPNPSLATITSRRRQAIARRLRLTDHDSDEEPGSSADEEEQMLRYIDEFGGNPAHFRALVAEDHIRATQLLRGQLSNKRVASRKALSSLQSVTLETLPATERTCVICYNDFGQTSPEGVIEAPLRLPRCQHVFGDHCIKKWFEEADSCPYCRDKVPSEPPPIPGARAFHNMIRMRNHIPQGNAPPATDESIFRMLAQHEHQDAAAIDAAMDITRARIRARQEGSQDNITPRPSQRRSPPSEAEGRRRTRVRHSSFHPSHPAGMFMGGPLRATPSGYQVSSRERVMAPHNPPGLGLRAESDRQLLTRYMERQSSMPSGPPMFYNPVDSGHPSHAVPQPESPMPSLTPSSPNNPTPSAAHLQMLSANNQAYYPNLAFGNVPQPPFSHQLPPLSTPSFENAAGNSSGAPTTTSGAESQMQ
ncbi:hypothetical protein F5144DRAFT_291057 [Chaetomium tenue]|uniref:Uncharacterized protein n=1 Tax=Chaetomium tenue TaxID=1854479 RepID=A0ACB7P2S3_9PEZI|nr:hypothetical protein F5144DRAFT_291057 [Chaetomium globosum]